MTGVIVRQGESIEKALRRFTKMVERSGLENDIKKLGDRYEKPSVTRRKTKNTAIRRAKKDREEATNRE